MTSIASISSQKRFTAHAVYVGDHIRTAGIEGDALATMPLAIGAGQNGVAVLFRYGVAVLIGLSPEEEADFLKNLAPRISGKLGLYEDETVTIEVESGDHGRISAGALNQAALDGPILVNEMSLERLLVLSVVLAKSVVLAHDEGEVAKVFDIIEPFARELATHGSTRRNQTAMLKIIGQALLVQHRVSGRVAVADKPDALWDRPDLEKFYGRLEDEYELQERVDALNRKLDVIAETAKTLADIMNTTHAHRLEWIVILLIACGVVFSMYEIYSSYGAP